MSVVIESAWVNDNSWCICSCIGLRFEVWCAGKRRGEVEVEWKERKVKAKQAFGLLRGRDLRLHRNLVSPARARDSQIQLPTANCLALSVPRQGPPWLTFACSVSSKGSCS